MTLTIKELKLLKALILNAIKNGNRIDPEPYKPKPEEYKLLFELLKHFE